MNISRLKELRRLAKERIYLVPINGDMNKCLICRNQMHYANHTWYSEEWWYYKAIDSEKSDIKENTINTIVYKDVCDKWRPTTLRNIPQSKTALPIYSPYTLEEALVILARERREFILSEIAPDIEKRNRKREAAIIKQVKKMY